MSAQQVLLAGARLRELLRAAAERSPHPVRIARVVLREVEVEGPLPRGPDGEHDLDEVARALAVDAGVETSAGELEATPAVTRLLERLPAALEVPGPFAPGQRLEDDLGVDSLALVQLRALLELEFGVRVADDAVWRLRTVGDVLRLVVGPGNAPVDTPDGATIDTPIDASSVPRVAADCSWPARLREPAVDTLDQRFNLRRRGLRHATAQVGMWIITLLARLAFRIELVNGERLPREGPFLLCPTHQSLLDSPLIYGTFPSAMVHRTVFIAFGPYFRSAPLSWLVRMGRLILTGEGGSVADSLRLAFDGLRRGLVVCIFPEGGCSPGGEVMPPRPGVGILACEAQVPLVPVVFEGSGGTCSPRQPGLRPTKIRVLVGEPIAPPPPRGAFSRADYDAVAARWREAVVRLRAEEAGARP